MTEAEREEIIRQLLKLLEGVENDRNVPIMRRAEMAVAKQLVRKLSPGKSDGDGK